MAVLNCTKTVVLIDDDEIHLYAFGKQLEQWGWVVHTAHNGPEGVELSRAVKPPLIFMDLNLKGGADGFETCAHIRGEAWSAQTIIVAASGRERDLVEERALRSGFDLYLLKPFSDNLLRKVLEQAQTATGLNDARA